MRSLRGLSGAEVEARYPEGEILDFNTQADIYSAIDSGKVDAGIGFVSQIDELKISHSDIALISEPISILHYGFGMPNTSEGEALLTEFNDYLRMISENGEYEEQKKKWEEPDRDGDVMDEHNFSGEKGTLKIVTGGSFAHGRT